MKDRTVFRLRDIIDAIEQIDALLADNWPIFEMWYCDFSPEWRNDQTASNAGRGL